MIGGAAIMDVMLLVIDATKGIQTQTAECLVLGEMLVQQLLLVVNKADLLPAEKDRARLERGLRATFKATKFGADVPIVWTACPPPGSAAQPSTSSLLAVLSSSLTVPSRDCSSPLYLPIDHCFPIHGAGTVLTGTIITGSVSVSDVIDLPALGQQRKVKSVQSFKQPVERAQAGDRVAVCVVGLDAAQVERGLACGPGSVVACERIVVKAEKVRFYKSQVKTGSQLHCSIGHDTLVATCSFFAPATPGLPAASASPSSPPPLPDTFDPSLPYLHLPELPPHPCLALLTFPHAIFLPAHFSPVIVASHLNSAYTGNACRIAFSARILPPLLPSSPSSSPPPLLLYRLKQKQGVVDRVSVPGQELIGRGMFRAAEEVARYAGMRVELEGGGVGRMEGGFGKGGKFRLRLEAGGSSAVGGEQEGSLAGRKLLLRYKQFMPDAQGKKRITQD